MSESPHGVFVADGDTYVPTQLARGPWGDFMSGQYVGGLLASVIERGVNDDDLHPTRVTVDLSGRAALEPVTVRTTVLRDGSRIRLVDAEMVQGDKVVAHARAVYLRRGEQSANEIWTAPVTMPPLPEVPSTPPPGSASHGFIYSADNLDDPGADLRVWENASQKFIWLTYLTPLISGEKLTPLTRAIMVADSASAVANYGSTGLHFINADYTVTLARLPEGPSLGMAGLTQHSEAGVATGSVALFDKHGSIGTVVTVGIANRGFRPGTSKRD
ncbi:acyl-CoA thioesterase domain-containing protein [Nocardia bovistercoris]|uniref:Thioesterase family protein n=1 Tax=Nocardia bovistercoris TaxID=2785916 RepID=A0A931IA94_9NOCA|nr:acyl-CoA thioesterase domain-containing protein [Nocardia bovistercoris]MBH0777852.1 thioesterase family protein [Nocardia bovistercoris]